MTPTRWVHGTKNEREEAVAQHLRRLPPAATLSPRAVEQIAARLDEAAVRVRRPWLSLGLTTAAAAMALIALLAWRARPPVREIIAGAHQSLLLSDEGGLRLVLIGPGRAELPRDGSLRSLRLRAGRLAVSSASTPVVIESDGGRLTVRPHAVAEIELYAALPRVAVYSGAASVTFSEVQSGIELRAGSAVSPLGALPLQSGRRGEIEALLELRQHQVIAPPTAPVVPPSAPAPSAPASPPAHAIAAHAATPRARESVPASRPAPPAAPVTISEPSAPVAIALPQASALPRAAVTPSVPPPSSAPLQPRPSPPPSAAPPPSSPSLLRLESELLARALGKLRHGNDARAAVAAVKEYRTRFPSGALRPEADRIWVEALLRLGRRAEALTLLDGMTLRPQAEREWLVLRGELRAENGRCVDAIGDFAPLLGEPGDHYQERALYGHARCAAKVGDEARARADLEQYLSRFPSGSFATAARRALAGK